MTGPVVLASWRDGPARQSIIDFVMKVTTPGGPDFVPLSDLIAVFDNDGTLWVERPLPVQMCFVLDRVRALAPDHPEWRDRQPFKAALEGDVGALVAAGMADIAELVMATHAGMTTEAFAAIVKDWIVTAILDSSGPIPTWFISRCSKCWPSFAPMASGRSSCRVAGSSSCGSSPKPSMASRLNR
jgi:hypothetical protein